MLEIDRELHLTRISEEAKERPSGGVGTFLSFANGDEKIARDSNT